MYLGRDARLPFVPIAYRDVEGPHSTGKRIVPGVEQAEIRFDNLDEHA
jgi:hypothetical protein